MTINLVMVTTRKQVYSQIDFIISLIYYLLRPPLLELVKFMRCNSLHVLKLKKPVSLASKFVLNLHGSNYFLAEN